MRVALSLGPQEWFYYPLGLHLIVLFACVWDSDAAVFGWIGTILGVYYLAVYNLTKGGGFVETVTASVWAPLAFSALGAYGWIGAVSPHLFGHRIAGWIGLEGAGWAAAAYAASLLAAAGGTWLLARWAPHGWRR